MNIIITNAETNFKEIKVEEIETTYDIDFLSLLMQLYEYFEEYKERNENKMPKTITDMIENINYKRDMNYEWKKHN